MKFVPGVRFTAYGHEDPRMDDEDQTAVVYVIEGKVVEPTEEERTQELYDSQSAGRVDAMVAVSRAYAQRFPH